MHESLKVYLKDSFVGWLSHESAGDEFSFKYDDAYLANPVDGVPWQKGGLRAAV